MTLAIIIRDLGVAQFGSALPWGGRGRGFKSRHSDQIRTVIFKITVLIIVLVSVGSLFTLSSFE